MSAHVPILVQEILEFAGEIPHGVSSFFDGTFGRGGHTKSVIEKFPKVRVLAVDRDFEAVQYAQEHLAPFLKSGQLQVLHADYCDIRSLLADHDTGFEQFDLVLLDLGVSSPQLDIIERGFSFQGEGPLDMRMNQNDKVKAEDIINGWSEDELVELFKKYGEVKSPQRVVRAIIHDRKETPFKTTADLAGLIARVEGWKKKGVHPATQYFLALRIQVNGELHRLEGALRDCMSVLVPNGRLCVITFHSLEDRIVKHTFVESEDMGFPVNKRVVIPSDDEIKQNPRSRSAKLRVFQRSLERVVRAKKDKYAHKKGS